jgi:hypothetical protein
MAIWVKQAELMDNGAVPRVGGASFNAVSSQNEQSKREFKKRMLAIPTKTQLRILACLIDDHGHPLWEIAEELEADQGQISRAIDGLIKFNVIYRGTKRPSTHEIRYEKVRGGKRPEKRPETPLYINKELEIITRLDHHVKFRLNHLGTKGTKAPTILEILSNWLDATKNTCKSAGLGRRLDPKPLTDEEIGSLSLGMWPDEFEGVDHYLALAKSDELRSELKNELERTDTIKALKKAGITSGQYASFLIWKKALQPALPK